MSFDTESKDKIDHYEIIKISLAPALAHCENKTTRV